jgi:lipopolysaccharide export system permease protein
MILARHILREHLAPFLYALFVITAIFLVDFVVQIMDSILTKGLDPHVVLELFVLNTAWMLALSIPMSVLVASLMAFGRMSSDREIDAMRAAGVHPARMILPSLVCAVLVSASLVWFNNKVLPEANFRAASLREDISRKRPSVMLEPRTMIQDFDGFRIWIQEVDPATDSLRDLLIHQLDRNGGPPTVITARSGSVVLADADRTWKFTLHDGETHSPDRAEPTRYARIEFRELLVDVPNVDSRLHRSEKGYRSDREMPIEAMQERVDAAKNRERTQIAESGERLFADLRFVTNLLELDSASRANAGKAPDTLSVDSAVRLGKNADGSVPGARARNKASAAKQAPSRKKSDAVVSSGIRAFGGSRVETASDALFPPQSGAGELSSLLDARQRETRIAREQIKVERDEANRFLVEIHKKFSIPAACIVFVLVGAPLGIMARSGGIGTGVAYSLAFFILYWAGLIGGESLADRGVVRPALAMWGPNILLGFLGIWLVSRMGRDVQFFPLQWVRSLFARIRPARRAA